MGEVYRATDTVLGRTVAVKLLAERHARNPEIRPRFEREGRAAARLSASPNIVTVFDVGEHEGRPFIVMEYLGGGSVEDRLRAGRPEGAQALDWLEQTARALDTAHEQGVVHRDVKPANLLLDDHGTVRVTDFGIAFSAGFDTLTLPGTVLGTAGYLSPEQARGEPATPASDRYALGVVAFELLTGRRPYAGDTPVTEALGHVSAAVPRASTIAPALPAGIDDVFARALAKSPEERPSTCAELVDSLRAVFEDQGKPTLVTAPAPVLAATTTVQRHRSRAPSKAYAVAAAVVLAGGLGVAALVGTAGDDPPAQRTSRSTPDTSTPVTTTEPNTDEGAELNEQGFALMQEGDYSAALPLLNRSVDALAGTGTLDEAYASYNLAFSRFAIGNCSGVLQLLARSELIQGHRDEIDDLRAQAEDACLEGSEEGEGRGNGKKKGHEEDD
jgi:serine/threonine protein kinase